MQFTWVDYPAQHATEIDTWCDKAATEFALDNDTISEEHQEYLDEDYRPGYNYFCKVALEGETPVALVMLTIDDDPSKEHLTEEIVNFETILINPALRNRGYGAKVVMDIINHAPALIDHGHNVFVMQIHKDNAPSVALAKKLEFTFIPDEDEDTWFNWVYPPSAAARFQSLWEAL
ncbi:MAG: GNAT family N-acetyltransferase [Defluviitaleaceae bacterium]|nr:GNAT family N-acetyltransferase [Defluviitaleaceae bacterium]MCL2275675.1 GNAT family N-acetyltransferase [Defluviitaleaceae bacterium]